MSYWQRYNKYIKVASDSRWLINTKEICRLFIRWYVRIAIAMFTIGVAVGMIAALMGYEEIVI